MRDWEVIEYLLSYQCVTMAKCFELASINGWDSDIFAKQVMTTDYGISVIRGDKLSEYSCEEFMLEGFERELSLKKGLVYDTDVMWMTGYVYRYWVGTRGTDPREIYKIAPIKLLGDRYGAYHTQGFDYIIDDIIDRPYRGESV